MKILLYHNISENESSFVKGTNVWISSLTFAKHMKYVKKHYKVISLQSLVESLKQGKMKPRSVVITFDDGFADNFYSAYPYLKKYGIPATFFLATDCIDQKRPIWNQELCYLINTCGVENVIVVINSVLDSSKNSQFMECLASNTELPEIIEEYMGYSLSKKDRDKTLEEIYKKLNIPREKIFSENNVFLNWNQVNQMHKDGMHFGNHGESNTPFSMMAPKEQETEIINSKEVIGKNIGSDFVTFSYPFGQARDFTTDTQKIIENSGHSCILTAMPTLNTVHTSPYELGRIVVHNIPVYRLAFELEKAALKKFLLCS